MADTKTEYKEDKNNIGSNGQPKATSNGKDLPDFKEIVEYIYSSYMGDELISGVECLQEKYPSLKPFIYSSSVMSIIPLAIFAQSVLFIFSANVFVGTFAIYGYRKACNIPQVENMGNFCYNKIYSVMSSKEKNTEENSPERSEEIKSLKRIFAKLYDIMDDVNNSLKLAFAKSTKGTERDEDSKKGVFIATIYGFFEPLALMFKGKPKEDKHDGNQKKKSEYTSSDKPSEKHADNENDDKKSDYASSGTPSKSPVPEGLPPNESSPASELNKKNYRTDSNSYEKEEPHIEEKESYADVVKENINDNNENESYADAVKDNHEDNDEKPKESYADVVKENHKDNEDKESYADVVKENCADHEDKENCSHDKSEKNGLVTGTTSCIDNKKDDTVEAAGLPQDDTKTSGVVDEPEATKDVYPII